MQPFKRGAYTSGYLALHIITSLLGRGYAVRGTVRNEEKGAYLKAMFKNDNLEYVVVPSIEAPGAFDEAVKGVDGVIHAASPVGNFTADTDTFIRMA
ncbi:methylglyoxal reductase (NADPH-dependent) gre2, partial [Tulasnella sp. 418]